MCSFQCRFGFSQNVPKERRNCIYKVKHTQHDDNNNSKATLTLFFFAHFYVFFFCEKNEAKTYEKKAKKTTIDTMGWFV